MKITIINGQYNGLPALSPSGEVAKDGEAEATEITQRFSHVVGWVNESDIDDFTKFIRKSRQVYLTTDVAQIESKKPRKGDIIEMTGNLSPDLLSMSKPRLGLVENVNGAYILVKPEGKTYSVDFLENEVRLYKRGTTDVEGEQKEAKHLTEQEMLNQPKEQVIDRQFKNNCDYGFKQPNVNKFIRIAFESGFENGLNYQKYHQSGEQKDTNAGGMEKAKQLLRACLKEFSFGSIGDYKLDKEWIDNYNKNNGGKPRNPPFKGRYWPGDSKGKLLNKIDEFLNK